MEILTKILDIVSAIGEMTEVLSPSIREDFPSSISRCMADPTEERALDLMKYA